MKVNGRNWVTGRRKRYKEQEGKKIGKGWRGIGRNDREKEKKCEGMEGQEEKIERIGKKKEMGRDRGRARKIGKDRKKMKKKWEGIEGQEENIGGKGKRNEKHEVKGQMDRKNRNSRKSDRNCIV